MSKRKEQPAFYSSAKKECKITTKGNPEQAELARLIRDTSTKIIFCTGNAGTGKTFIAAYTAYCMVREKLYEKIMYSRDVVQLGTEMGYLPGDLSEKFDPFMACLMDNLESIERLGGPNAHDMAAKIERVPLTFLRGRSIDNCVLIVDEAQNLDLPTLKAILTRVGDWSKVILLGSMNQIDNKAQAKKEICDFERVMNQLDGLDFVGRVRLTQSKRSKICSAVDEELAKLK